MAKTRILRTFLFVCGLQGGGLAFAFAADEQARPFVLAQVFNRPSADVPEAGQDGAALLVRIDRLEAQIRAMTGQIEQLQFQQRKLEETLRRTQQDTEFRFQDLQGRSGQATVPRASPPAPTGTAVPVAGAGAGAPPFAGPVAPAQQPAVKRGDAFDPATQPNAPGAPRQLGSATGDSEADAPLDLTKPQRSRTAALANPVQTDAVPPRPASATGATGAGGPTVAGLPPQGTQRDEFETGRGLFKLGHFDAAQAAFTTFLQKNPKDARVPEATYFLGESYFQRGRHREAAEEYLKLSTEYPKAPRAPEGLLRLGMSLDALGAREQACATFQEVGRKYPKSSDAIKSAADREFKRAKC